MRRTPRATPYNFFKTAYNINGVPTGARFHGEYQTDTLGRFGRELVGKYAGRKPFFLYLSFVAPHHGDPDEADDPHPVQRADGSWQEFPTTARPDWVKGRFDHLIRHAPGVLPSGETEADATDKPGYLQTRPELTAAERAALVEVTRQRAEAIYVMDLQIGRLVQRLKQTGEWRDTILMFTSDNGYFLGEHRIRQGKTTAHEPSLRVPFLMVGPGVPSGEQRFDPITTVDITATLLDLAGAAADPPAAPDGVSVVPSLDHGDQGWDRPVLNEALLRFMTPSEPGFDERGSIGIRTSRWSMIRYANGAGELYDLRTDPSQLTNLFRVKQYADVRAALTKVWWQVKDCQGAACRTAVLPPSLRATPEEAADDYRTWAGGVRGGNSPVVTR
ncbi:sulfatase [Nocardioides speluncae]|uniref:sulfatase family protein n=1 Tax=Nocardioides speluncae TaxID=2670337 RepID=UPI000D68D727|nr:sulfatase-like hydrolase/transferase [Nocardioides speluncae]